MSACVGCLAFTNKALLYNRASECHLVTHKNMICTQRNHSDMKRISCSTGEGHDPSSSSPNIRPTLSQTSGFQSYCGPLLRQNQDNCTPPHPPCTGSIMLIWSQSVSCGQQIEPHSFQSIFIYIQANQHHLKYVEFVISSVSIGYIDNCDWITLTLKRT